MASGSGGEAAVRAEAADGGGVTLQLGGRRVALSRADAKALLGSLGDALSGGGEEVRRGKRARRVASLGHGPAAAPALPGRPRVAIIVPFRDQREQRRAAQLEEFMHMMPRWLGLEPGSARVIVAVQPNDGRKFNRGLLLNAGARVAMRQGFQTLILHDVDLLPSDDLREWYTRAEPPGTALHIGSRWGRYDYAGYLGGVLKLGAADFAAANGFPNSFWGWGGEDDAFAARLASAGVTTTRPTVGSLRDLEAGAEDSCRASTRVRDGGREEWRNMTRKEDLARDRGAWRSDGLSSLAAVGSPLLIAETPACMQVLVRQAPRPESK